MGEGKRGGRGKGKGIALSEMEEGGREGCIKRFKCILLDKYLSSLLTISPHYFLYKQTNKHVILSQNTTH